VSDNDSDILKTFPPCRRRPSGRRLFISPTNKCGEINRRGEVGKNSIFSFGTIIHKAYLEHLFNKFSYLCTSSASVKKTDRKLFNTSSYYFVTRQLRAITELHTLFYRTPPPAGRPRLGAALPPPRGEGRKVRIKAVPIQVLNESREVTGASEDNGYRGRWNRGRGKAPPPPPPPPPRGGGGGGGKMLMRTGVDPRKNG
jgi:hypothetical protein